MDVIDFADRLDAKRMATSPYLRRHAGMDVEPLTTEQASAAVSQGDVGCGRGYDGIRLATVKMDQAAYKRAWRAKR